MLDRRQRQQTIPPRPLRSDERDLVAEWLAAAGDISLAYVSSRNSDDPTIYQRVVIITEGNRKPTYLIDNPMGTNVWIVAECCRPPAVYGFPSLRQALNFIRPVLPAQGVG